MKEVSLFDFDLISTASITQPFRVLGIDLGTTNSVVAYIDVYPGSKDIQIEVVNVEQDTRSGMHYDELVPSAIAIHNNTIYIGQGAIHCRSFMGAFDLEQDRNIFWDTKNYIGVQRTLHKAPEGFQNAKEIAAKLLQFLYQQAKPSAPFDLRHGVVTVPASFNFKQKSETKEAADAADLVFSHEVLIDEPTAAFIAYMWQYRQNLPLELSAPKNLVVFDFGGGTCDVAVFRLHRGDGQISKSPLAVSRYHRLGGGDIDRAIVVDVLLPQLQHQNNLTKNDLDFYEKSKVIIPHLLGVAETLKIGLCGQIAQAKKFGKYEHEHKDALEQTNARTTTIELTQGKTLTLKSPTLSATQFERVLARYLDGDLLYHQETEYVLFCSIFAPLEDALSRAQLAASDVDYCLAVGGSCLIPQVQESLAEYFSNAEILTFTEYRENQTCVARGATLQALSLAGRDRGLIQPKSSDSVSIRIEGGKSVQLIPAIADLPYPEENGWASLTSLRLPKQATTESYPLRLELVNSANDVISRDSWEIRPIANKGDPLLLQYRMDENQCLDLKLSLVNDPEHEIFRETRNPLSNIVNPASDRERILDLEERMRSEALTRGQQREIVKELADLEEKLGNLEKALYYFTKLNQIKPQGQFLHRMALICGKLQDFEREEKFYREAARLSPHSGASLFNLSLSLRRQGRLNEALDSVEEAIQRDSDPVYYVLKFLIVEETGLDEKSLKSDFRATLSKFPPLKQQTKFQLFWYRLAARQTNDKTVLQEIKREEKRRKKPSEKDDIDGYLPLGSDDRMPVP